MVTSRPAATNPVGLRPEAKAVPDWRGKRITVMGLGTHGGGVGAVRFLCRKGARVTVTDLRTEQELAPVLAEISNLPLERLRLGQHDEADLLTADAVVVNPAVKPTQPLLQELLRRGIPLTTEVGLLWQHTCSRVIAITGSVGKSTTACLIDALLRADGRRTWLGGNLGGSLLDVCDAIQPEDELILELSSFQLWSLARMNFRPNVAVVTNFFPNHLDWHPDLEHYRTCKRSLLTQQGSGDLAVLNGSDRDVATWRGAAHCIYFLQEKCDQRPEPAGPCVWFNPQRIWITGDPQPWGIDWSSLPAKVPPPLQENAAAAVAVCHALGASSDALRQGLSEFRPLPHRLEDLGLQAGRRWINDSKATIPAAAQAAISALPDPPWVLLGGADKQVDLQPFCESIARQIRGAALLGELAPVLDRLLGTSSPTLPRCQCSSLQQAIDWLLLKSSPGETILLSPACSSLDWFRDYQDRGDQFRELVRRAGRTTNVSATSQPAVEPIPASSPETAEIGGLQRDVG